MELGACSVLGRVTVVVVVWLGVGAIALASIVVSYHCSGRYCPACGGRWRRDQAETVSDPHTGVCVLRTVDLCVACAHRDEGEVQLRPRSRGGGP